MLQEIHGRVQQLLCRDEFGILQVRTLGDFKKHKLQCIKCGKIKETDWERIPPKNVIYLKANKTDHKKHQEQGRH